MLGPLGALVRKTFHGYAAATRMRPEWRVQFLVFQAGLPKTRGNSITGGGQIYGHEYMGTFMPLQLAHSAPVLNLTGSGQVVALPPELAGLYGGNAGIGS